MRAKELPKLSGHPEAYRRLALEEIERTAAVLRSLDDTVWRLQTCLPFWRVCDVVGHLYVASGFLTSSTRILATPLLRPPWVQKIVRAFGPVSVIALPVLHYSNIIMPRLAGIALSREFSISMLEDVMAMLSRSVESLPSCRLEERLPYFGWSVPIQLYLAVMAKEFGVHRWEIESAIRPATLRPQTARAMVELLWAAAPMYAKAAPNLHGEVSAQTRGGTYRWRLEGGRIKPLPPSAIADVQAAINGADDALALAMMGRTLADELELSGDPNLCLGFLSAFSWRVGPTPFFNP